MLEVLRFNREPVAVNARTNPMHASTAGLRRTKFVLVNDRIRRDADNPLCGSKTEKSQVRKSRTRQRYCDTQCFAGHANALKSRARKMS